MILDLVTELIAMALKQRAASPAPTTRAEGTLRLFLACSRVSDQTRHYNVVFHDFFARARGKLHRRADSRSKPRSAYREPLELCGAIGLLAFKGNCCVQLRRDPRPAMFQWGAAVGHIRASRRWAMRRRATLAFML